MEERKLRIRGGETEEKRGQEKVTRKRLRLKIKRRRKKEWVKIAMKENEDYTDVKAGM